jgi:hypothetical protein
MILLSLVAVAFSGVILVLLGLGDPKRRRAAGLGNGEMIVAKRRLLAGIACLPALLCVALGDAAAFMIWLGGCAMVGWFVALWFGQAGKDAA